MESTHCSVWNPLSYLLEEEIADYLDLDEMFQLGRRTATIAHEQKVPLLGYGHKVLGREVGDDRVDLSRTPDPLCATLVVQEDVIKMVTSPEDTSIRKRSWNFCEVTSGPLTDPSQGYDHIRKVGDFTNLGFNDSVVLRIILDVQKGEGEEHSSTQPGKMSMLGSRLATPRKENRGMWMVASIFQDAMLCTHKASEPKYLPPQMGGTGVTALFDNPNNVFLYVLAYRGGSYRRIYATACSELREYLYNLERGIQSAPILCPRLREKQEYFWGTYAEKVFIPKAGGVTNDDEPPPPLYEQTGGQNRYQNFENRLLRTRHVVTRKQAQVEWAHTRRLQSIFLCLFDKMEVFERIDKDRSRTMRARYDNALAANSALQNLLRREAGQSDAMKLMGSDNFYTLTVGKRDFTRADAEWVYLNGQGESYSLHDVSLSEDIFVREEVSVEETFKVGGIPLRPYFSCGEQLRPTKIKVGLYNINQTMEEWSENLLERLRNERDRLGRPLRPSEMGPICDQDREWVNDDSGLIAQAHRVTSGTKASYKVVLVSRDRRLANQMAETCNATVIRLDPREFVRLAHSHGYAIDANIPTEFLKEYGVDGDVILTDSGAISAASVRMVEENGVIHHRSVLETGWYQGHRFSRISLTKVWKTRLMKEIHRPVTRPRIWRSGSRPHESAYSSHSSWKRSVRSSRTDSSWWRGSTSPTLTTRLPAKLEAR
nr:MAG: hypothetical protein [Leptosphaeria biglobosa narnavirus 2]